MDFPVSIRIEKLPNTPPHVNVYYPLVHNLENQQAQHAINTAIVTLLNNLLVEQSYYAPNLVELIANFEIKNNQRGILSLNLIVYSFTGGAHGMTIVKSLTFDTKTGKQYTLKELFKSNSDYVKKLSTIIDKDIKKWQVDLLEPFKSIRPDQDFYIADTSLVVYFQLYEITPYYWGFPYFPIPILDVQDIIQPNAPLDTMMSFT
ncbi:DUF3298 and DUF4163 domain-containing protein [Sporosarcina pasteurii]|uniref:Anti-sigma-V factor rsiV n=1 Tax=Sporosarcina pasteurii TaxID=1474 RepID=A0A380C6N6_SPOPA|nr:DUF3298 and DUF4163 domain-containing protein [Sporosarcina pasteurii]MDS9471812.1 DUF3298 and DUF4163 domain-containing protein [Sporosarcina pasteurii]QBQ04596.1 DUF3298/DUF4163 domain-containing protein [Sporosarcina pasteurii]SUJ13943.1 Anti-sigma-V factor rsiV [Sporosarcina pasteurii]